MAEKVFSLILPTRDRPKLARRLLKSITETTSDIDGLEILLYLDSDDVDSHQISYPQVPLCKIIDDTKNMGAIMNECYACSQGKFIMLLNDDMLFCTVGWDVMILEEFSRFSDGIALVYGNDLYYGSRMSTFPILSRAACEMMGGICPAQYKRHCIDPHIFDIFFRLAALGYKRSLYLPRVIFEHMHYELSVLAYTGDTRLADDTCDQEIFSSLADSRQDIAVKMARYIKSQSTECTKTGPLKSI